MKAKKSLPSNETLLWYPNALGATAVLLMEVGSDRNHFKDIFYNSDQFCFFALKVSGSNVGALGPNGECFTHVPKFNDLRIEIDHVGY